MMKHFTVYRCLRLSLAVISRVVPSINTHRAQDLFCFKPLNKKLCEAVTLRMGLLQHQEMHCHGFLFCAILERPELRLGYCSVSRSHMNPS